MGHWQDEHTRRAVVFHANCGDDRAGPVLATFLAAFKMFATPKIALSNDQARYRPRERRPCLLQLVVEEGEFGWDFDVANRLDPFLGKLCCQSDAPVAALQAIPLLRRHDDERVAPLFGDDHRLLSRRIAQGAEGVLKLTGRYADRGHMKNLYFGHCAQNVRGRNRGVLGEFEKRGADKR
jgi:hypothetical protein